MKKKTDLVVEIEEVNVVLTAIGLSITDNLSDVFANKSAARHVMQRADCPTAVFCLEQLQTATDAALHNAVTTSGRATTRLVALEENRRSVEFERVAQSAVFVVPATDGRVSACAARGNAAIAGAIAA